VKKNILSLLCTSLFAGPPMHSNDPFVPSLGEFEINIAWSGESRDETLQRAPIVDLNYGIIENVQVTLESAYVHTDTADDIDSFELALKWNFYTGSVFAIALYPQYVSYPIESIFGHGEDYELSIPVSIAINEKIDLVVDTTYVIPFEGENHFEFGSYLKYSMQKHTYFAEIFLEEEGNSLEFFTLGSLGYMYQFHEHIAFMISYGVELTTKSTKVTSGYTGLQFVF